MKKSGLKRNPQNSLKRNSSLCTKKGLKGGGKLKVRSKTEQEKELISAQNQAMLDVFNIHWQQKRHVCESCDDPIWGENSTIYHHHLLSKSKYKNLRYELQNLMLLCWKCHSQTEAGYPDQKVIERTNQAKIRFNV